MSPMPVLDLAGVSVVAGDRVILAPLTWRVLPGERWLVLGANGSGKTTLLNVVSMYLHPSTGSVTVLGERLGRTDVRVLRRRIGFMSAALAGQLRPALAAIDVVMTARYAALEPWWHTYTDDDRAAALRCLGRLGVAWAAQRPLGTLSSGEQQRVLLARTLMNDPGVIALDEPSARLDLGGREHLVSALGELTLDPLAAPLILVTHHLDEAPPGMTHVLMLRDGSVVASGPIDETLSATSLSETFAMALQLERRPDGRLTAWASPGRSADRAPG